MKCSYSTVLRSLLCLALTATAAWAEEVKEVNDTPDEGITANCDLTNYKHETASGLQVSVPDNNAAGVILGPLVLPPDGLNILDVVIDLRMTHTWVGDLIVVVGYDATCDGSIDAQSVLLCRPRGTGLTTPAPCGTGTGFGCSGDLGTSSALLFDDTAAAPIAEGVCPTLIAPGCYKPSTVGGSPLSVFEGRPKGGCWYLSVSDRALGDLGVILEWSVHILNDLPIGIEQTSWSTTKTLYR